MLPSVGSTSMPADEPHFLPSGSLPQFAVTIGAGFGRPSPVIGFPEIGLSEAAFAEAEALAVSEFGEHPLSRMRIAANSVDVSSRGEDMVVPLIRSRQSIPVAAKFHLERDP